MSTPSIETATEAVVEVVNWLIKFTVLPASAAVTVTSFPLTVDENAPRALIAVFIVDAKTDHEISPSVSTADMSAWTNDPDRPVPVANVSPSLTNTIVYWFSSESSNTTALPWAAVLSILDVRKLTSANVIVDTSWVVAAAVVVASVLKFV